MCCAPGPAVELQVLVDLRLLAGHRRLVERELDLAGAVGDHLAHQRRVVGGDVVADELGHVGEAHDPLVELHPLVHPAELDVADDVVDGLEEPLRLQARVDRRLPVDDRPAGDEAGQERARRSGTGRPACGGCRRTWRWPRTGPCRARRSSSCGSVRGRGALRDRVRVRGVHVRHLQRDVDDAVAVPGDVLGAAVRPACTAPVKHEPRRAAGQHVLGVVAEAAAPGRGRRRRSCRTRWSSSGRPAWRCRPRRSGGRCP